MFPGDYSARERLFLKVYNPPAGIQLHVKEVFFDFHISEWYKPDQIRTPEPNMIFNVNFGLEVKY